MVSHLTILQLYPYKMSFSKTLHECILQIKNMEHLRANITGFITNTLAIYMNLVSFEAINQLLTLVISCLAITYWVAKLKILKKGKKK